MIDSAYHNVGPAFKQCADAEFYAICWRAVDGVAKHFAIAVERGSAEWTRHSECVSNSALLSIRGNNHNIAKAAHSMHQCMDT
jgi:hypothetical protein